MGTLSTKSPQTDSSLELIRAMIHDPELEARFPNRSAFISSDSPQLAKLVGNAAGEERPVVVTFPGGGYMIVQPHQADGALTGELHLT